MYSIRSPFKDRKDAGRKLGALLKERNFASPVLLALPRGGVTVAQEVAEMLSLPLDVVISRKIGAPHHPEYGIGAMSEDEVPHFNPDIRGYYNIDGEDVRNVVEAERKELRRRMEHYRSSRKIKGLKGKTVILVDDGLATGVSAAAAGKFLRKMDPQYLILAVPVGPRELSLELSGVFDEVICLERPENFTAVGIWYDDFGQVEDREVMEILERRGPRP